MINKKLEELEEKIEKLEKIKMDYLESDNNVSARRIAKQIEKLEFQKEFLSFNKLKNELNIYKSVVKHYPGIESEIRIKLKELNYAKYC